jgi:hypothetical protein
MSMTAVDHVRAAFLISLDHKADTVPAGQLRLEAQRFQQVQRELQAVGFFSVDVQADVVLRPAASMTAGAGKALPLRVRTARGYNAGAGRQLDRNARAFIDPTAVRGFADGVNGLFVRHQILLCVVLRSVQLHRACRRNNGSLWLRTCGIGQRFGDGFAGHELLAHQAHRHVHAFADQRFAAFADNAAQRA